MQDQDAPQQSVGSRITKVTRFRWIILLLVFAATTINYLDRMVMGILVLGLATAAHQGFSSNLYTLVSDMFPRRCVASVAGFGGTAGYLGASIFQVFVGYSVQGAGNYTLPFICAGTAYFIALGVIQLFAPNIKPAVTK